MGIEDRDYYWKDRKRRVDKYGIDDYVTKDGNNGKKPPKRPKVTTKYKAYPEEAPYNYRTGRTEKNTEKQHQKTESQAQLNTANWPRPQKKNIRSKRDKKPIAQWRKITEQYIFFTLIAMGVAYGFHQYRLQSQQHQQKIKHEEFREQSCIFWTNHWDKNKDYRSYQKTKEYCD